MNTPIYDETVAEFGEPPTGAPVCICADAPADCSLHPVVRFAFDVDDDEEQARDEADAVTEELAAVGHA
ncbi:hypothetical protein [Alloactinosynnema sp. L-07]|uniref:hypothetical protein n=1 Tax=Alloactinosynnema sp. L-07 TaxID=1653480 RepID=UPI00065F0755|nr:hypothetical protein [Alloactinosynnema sp. L-07]CRK59030.1 hypothetical protein [Alloactinosynnema sp. L-07]